MKGKNSERKITFGTPLPLRKLKKKLSGLIPGRARREWKQIARLSTRDGRIRVFDPSYFHPDYIEKEKLYGITLQAQPGEFTVLFERLQLGKGHLRTQTVKVLFSHEQADEREEIGEVSVDSAILALASETLLLKRWQIGGPLCRASVFIDFATELSHEEGIVQREGEGFRAAELLGAEGFLLEHDSGWLYRFVTPMSNLDIERANSLLKRAQIKGSVNPVPHHSEAMLHAKMTERDIAYLDDAESPWLVAFMPGWGDGTYTWYAHKKGDQVVAFECVLIEEDE